MSLLDYILGQFVRGIKLPAVEALFNQVLLSHIILCYVIPMLSWFNRDIVNNRQLIRDFINYALLFVAFTLLGVLVVFTVGFFGASLLNSVPYFLTPNDSGLSDHIRYAETVGAIFGLLAYIAYLIYCIAKTISKTAIPWALAAVAELVLLALSLVDRSLGHAPYVASDFAATWLQLVVVVPLIIGYVYLASKNGSKQPVGKRSKKRA
jgi:hypothetical protein